VNRTGPDLIGPGPRPPSKTVHILFLANGRCLRDLTCSYYMRNPSTDNNLIDDYAEIKFIATSNQNGFTLLVYRLWRLTQVVLEKRPLNGCRLVVVAVVPRVYV